MVAVFDLTQNPFHLLDVSVRRRREDVVEAHEKALADGRADEAVLMRAPASRPHSTETNGS